MMNTFSFTVHFGTEEDCRNDFKVQRDKQDVKYKPFKRSITPNRSIHTMFKC